MKIKNIRKQIPNSLVEFGVFLICMIFFAIRDIPLFLYGGQCVFAAIVLYNYRFKTVNYKFICTWIAFLVWVLLSFLWAESFSNAFKMFKELIQVALVCVVLSFWCSDEKHIKRVLDFIAIAVVIMIIYTFLKTSGDEWVAMFQGTSDRASSQGRLGYSIGLHPNAMGQLCSIGILVWLYKWNTEKSKQALVHMGIILFFLVFTKSRAALLLLSCTIFLFWILNERKVRRVVIYVFVCILVACVAIWMIFNVPVLYKLIGFRFSGLLSFVDSSVTVDASTTGRIKLMTAGLRIFFDYPLLGVGIGNYANQAYENYGIWREVYAHSNIIEFLADFGSVGFLIYYVPRIWCTYRLIFELRYIKNQERALCALFASYNLARLIFDVIQISYEKEPEQIMYTLSFCYVLYYRRRRKMDLGDKYHEK